MKLGDAAASMGKGLFAGDAGTATLEMKIRGRQASNVPTEAAGKGLGVEHTGDAKQARFSNLVHWGYGTPWGAVRGLIGESDLEEKEATMAHLLAVWDAEQVMLPALDIASPFWQWRREGSSYRRLSTPPVRRCSEPRIRYPGSRTTRRPACTATNSLARGASRRSS